MHTHVDQIIENLRSGSFSLDAACQALLKASQSDPTGTRFWNQRIEAAMASNHISHSAARALMDALEGFQCDKTMWLDSAVVAPTGRSAASAPPSDRVREAERLLASFIERTTRKVPIAHDPLRASPLTGPVEWFDSAAMIAAACHPADPENVTIGSLLNDRYRILAHLGAGGIGQVFDAVDLMSPTGRERVTVKVVAVNLKYQPGAFETLAAAVHRTQHLVHRNIVTLRHIERQGDRVFIIMESLRGRWLSGLIREVRGKGLPQDVAWPIISGIASGLAFAHEQGVVHSDLSPHAVFLCDDGTAKILCFELVNALPVSNESLDVLDTLTLRAYTEAYAADPWAQHSSPHPADDLYPLGVIAYEMLTGMHPFQRCSLSMARQKGMTFAPVAGLNSRARKLMQRCLSFERRDRPKNAEGFLRLMQPGLLDRLLAAGT
jgi:Protein kinase domain